jgi:chitin-binding protein
VTTSIQSGAFTFFYRATAPHRGTFELFITNQGFNPNQPLRWSDLTSFALANGSYVFNANIPARTGQHIIFTTWQRSDSPEAFYTCSDVVFGGSVPTNTNTSIAPTPTRTNTPAAPTNTPTRTPTRTNTPVGPTATPTRTATATRTNTPVGPTNTPTRTPTSSGTPAWTAWTAYSVGQLVSYNGVIYRNIQAHTSQPGWEPPNVPALWARQ